MPSNRRPKILLVDDDPQLVEVYWRMLEGPYELASATSGEEALEVMSSDIDVVLLDRRMPGMKGSQVAKAIRERGYDCRIAMVTAIDPETDIVDMGIDDYLVKPVTGSKLRNVVDSLLRWNEYDEALREYFEHARKLAILEEEIPKEELESEEKYNQLKDRLSTLQAEADDLVSAAGSETIKELIRGPFKENMSHDSPDSPTFTAE